MALRLEPWIADPDRFYAALMAAHRGLDDASSRRLDARLVLLLANQIGDIDVLLEAVAAAVRGKGEISLPPETPCPPFP